MPTKLELELEQIDEQLIALQQKRNEIQQQILEDRNATPQKQVQLIIDKLTSEVQPLYQKSGFDLNVTSYGATDNGINIIITNDSTMCTFEYKQSFHPLFKSENIPTLFANLLPTLQEFINCLRSLYARQLKANVHKQHFQLLHYKENLIITFSHKYEQPEKYIDLRFVIDDETGVITNLTLSKQLRDDCDDYYVIPIKGTYCEVHIDLDSRSSAEISLQRQLEFNEERPFDYRNVVPIIQAFCDYIQSE
jgi:hypothetical protein